MDFGYTDSIFVWNQMLWGNTPLHSWYPSWGIFRQNMSKQEECKNSTVVFAISFFFPLPDFFSFSSFLFQVILNQGNGPRLIKFRSSVASINFWQLFLDPNPSTRHLSVFKICSLSTFTPKIISSLILCVWKYSKLIEESNKYHNTHVPFIKNK